MEASALPPILNMSEPITLEILAQKLDLIYNILESLAEEEDIDDE